MKFFLSWISGQGRFLHDCTGVHLSWQWSCYASWTHLESLGPASRIHIIWTTWPGTQLALLLNAKEVKSGEMESAICLITEKSVLRAVARVSSGTANKEAAAFCSSHPHNLLIRLKIWNVCDQCHSGLELLPANF
jgi:hypothetical protein